MTISIGARSSILSKAQVLEVLESLDQFYPGIEFIPTWIETTGDKDQITSLRTLGQTDFFTKEIDEMQLEGHFRISIHSAKDLPSPLYPGLKLVTLTKGLDSRDALVLRPEDSLASLPLGAKIATSSARREEAVRSLRNDATFVDIRGTVEKRLYDLINGEVDGVVIAEAALIRLQLTHLNRILLDCKTAPHQGKLAIIAKEDDFEMASLFSCLEESRKKVLYTGLEKPEEKDGICWIHHPFIETKPLLFSTVEDRFAKLASATHLIMTSKMGVRYFMKALEELNIDPEIVYEKECLSVGKITTSELLAHGFKKIKTASLETAEGVIELIKTCPQESSFFWPHSNQSRSVLSDFLQQSGQNLIECVLYDTCAKKPENIPNLSVMDEIFFSSPSTVDGFLAVFGTLPENIPLKAQGPVTEQYLETLKKTQVIKRKVAKMDC